MNISVNITKIHFPTALLRSPPRIKPGSLTDSFDLKEHKGSNFICSITSVHTDNHQDLPAGKPPPERSAISQNEMARLQNFTCPL